MDMNASGVLFIFVYCSYYKACVLVLVGNSEPARTINAGTMHAAA